VKKARKPWRRKAAFAALIVAAAILAVLAYASDAWSPGDEDLWLVREPMPQAENSFIVFQQAIESLDWPEQLLGNRIVAMTEGTEWDESFVKGFLERNEKALALFDRGIELPGFQSPVVLDARADRCAEWFELGMAVALRAVWHARHGRVKDAAADAMKLVDYGWRKEQCPSGLPDYFLGRMAQEKGLALLRQQAWADSLGPAELVALNGRLARFRDGDNGLAEAYRVEYMRTVAALEELKQGKTSIGALRSSDGIGTGTGACAVKDSTPVRLMVWSPYHFQLNRTRQLMARYYRPCLEGANTYAACASRLKALGDDVDRFRVQVSIRRWGKYRRNVTGEILCAMLAMPVGDFHRCRFKASAHLSATRLVLALHAYRVRNGQLPPSLEALVPDYIDAVPRDDLDGRPMRYQRSQGVVYSVGSDLVDDGGNGTPSEEGAEPPDLVFPVDEPPAPPQSHAPVDNAGSEGGE